MFVIDKLLITAPSGGRKEKDKKGSYGNDLPVTKHLILCNNICL